MTALGKLLRTTAFRLTLVYLLVVALFAAFLLGYFALNTRRLITEQITSTVEAEMTVLTQQYNQGGIRRLVVIIENRSRRPGSSLYLVTTPAGEGLAGNVGSLATGVLETPGWSETAYRRLDDTDGAEHHALVRVFQLPGGFRLLVGRDLEERERLHEIILRAGRLSLAIVVVLGVAGGVGLQLADLVFHLAVEDVEACGAAQRRKRQGRQGDGARARQDRKRPQDSSDRR